MFRTVKISLLAVIIKRTFACWRSNNSKEQKICQQSALNVVHLRAAPPMQKKVDNLATVVSSVRLSIGQLSHRRVHNSFTTSGFAVFDLVVVILICIVSSKADVMFSSQNMIKIGMFGSSKNSTILTKINLNSYHIHAAV